jgi:hypothetical protein
MQFTYSNSNNYLAGAKEVNDISTNIYNTARQTGVDVNSLIETERKARATKADAKNAAEGTIGQKAVNTNAIMKVNQIDAKSKKDVEKIMKPAKMAGALAATVNVGNMGLMMHQDMKLDQKEAAERKSWRQKQTEMSKKMYEESKEANAKTTEFIRGLTKQSGISIDQNGKPTLNSSNSSNTGSIVPITPSGGTVNRKEVYDYITKDLGHSHNKAYGLMANMDRESNFVANIRSGDDGGPGGLFQWKGSRQTPTVANLVNTGDWKGQIKYALNEPNEPSMQTFLNTSFTTPQAAAEFITRKFERPANPDNDVLKNNQFIAGYNYQTN